MAHSPVTKRSAPEEEARAPLALGLFMPNCSNAYSISTYKPVPDDWTYESNAQIARAAEVAGFEFLFPVAKWKGYGGKTDFLGISLETMTWAGALLAITRRINVFSTVHVPIFHPLVAAKMGATLDHIGNGRWGLNVVSGWSEREFGMMGIEVLPHAERYQRTEAYIEIVKGLWTCEPGTFEHESKWYRIRGGSVMPQPTRKPHPPIANAGVSDEAREMVARLCDWAFIALPSLEATAQVTADIRARAGHYGRSVKCANYPLVVWRETEREAEAERRRIVDHMDREAAENWARGLLPQSGSFDDFTLEMFALGAGALPIFGTREQVAEKLDRLYRCGIDGVLMVFLSYYEDTLRFAREIMPLLRQLGTIGNRSRP
ncbi:MAG TPA: LLM class flavin-dependent oxidoreductase [Candidatus Binataceae bacterium]|nr:LLM class flavin-dependent oxidoreductase [Candidatus Binataceae bacterium]